MAYRDALILPTDNFFGAGTGVGQSWSTITGAGLAHKGLEVLILSELWQFSISIPHFCSKISHLKLWEAGEISGGGCRVT